MNKVSLVRRRITRLMGIDPAPKNCGIVFMEKIKEDEVKGFKVLGRWTVDIGDIVAAKGNSDVYWASRVVDLMNQMRTWFDQADVVVIERQFVAPNSFARLPSYHVYGALIAALISRYGEDKVGIVDARSLKCAYFKEDERTTYEKRKQTAVDLCMTELEKAPIFRETDRIHDQADAYLVACYWYDNVHKAPQIRNTNKVGRPKKIEETPQPTPCSSISDDDYPPKKKRRTQRKIK
jgi:hypothetical protein